MDIGTFLQKLMAPGGVDELASLYSASGRPPPDMQGGWNPGMSGMNPTDPFGRPTTPPAPASGFDMSKAAPALTMMGLGMLKPQQQVASPPVQMPPMPQGMGNRGPVAMPGYLPMLPRTLPPALGQSGTLAAMLGRR